MANNLQVGYARAVVTPPMGIQIAGYYKERIADGVLDYLYVLATSIKSNDKTVLFMSIDHCGLQMAYVERFKKAVTERTGVPAEAIFTRHLPNTQDALQRNTR